MEYVETATEGGSLLAEPVLDLRAQLVPWEDYQRANDHVFPTAEAWRWFVRQNRAELLARGALCLLNKRSFVVPVECNAALLDIGRRLAAGRAA
ncbi:hypothetical protein [Rubrivivax sp. JA1026]|uniref:hypothetical protein n=1 Tax=Rubrivivax sp. JA1026 TaxID=2710888 RepID=UPI0013E946A7|nr:hypothetical protein [Rubrivivax sp. JA1026]